MKRGKKILAIMMCLVMGLTLMPVCSSADVLKSHEITIENSKYGVALASDTNGIIDSGIAERTVTVMAYPKTGYIVDELVITDEDQDEVYYESTEDGGYEFAMPDGDVNISVSYEKLLSADLGKKAKSTIRSYADKLELNQNTAIGYFEMWSCDYRYAGQDEYCLCDVIAGIYYELLLNLGDRLDDEDIFVLNKLYAAAGSYLYSDEIDYDKANAALLKCISTVESLLEAKRIVKRPEVLYEQFDGLKAFAVLKVMEAEAATDGKAIKSFIDEESQIYENYIATSDDIANAVWGNLEVLNAYGSTASAKDVFDAVAANADLVDAELAEAVKAVFAAELAEDPESYLPEVTAYQILLNSLESELEAYNWLVERQLKEEDLAPKAKLVKGGVSISWTASENEIAGYKVYAKYSDDVYVELEEQKIRGTTTLKTATVAKGYAVQTYMEKGGRTYYGRMCYCTSSIGKAGLKNVKAGKKKMTVSWKTVTGASHYRISYRTGKTTKYKTVSAKNTSTVIKSLKKGRKYTVKVKALCKDEWDDTVVLQTGWSTAKTVKIK